MFFPEGQVRVLVYGKPVNMRLSFDGLYALVRHTMGRNPMSGALFVFINRRAMQTKVLYWDRTGFCIRAKRLEEGRLLANGRQREYLPPIPSKSCFDVRPEASKPLP